MEKFPIDAKTGKRDPYDTLRRLGRFGQIDYIDQCEKLSSRAEYDRLINDLTWCTREIQMWMMESDNEGDGEQNFLNARFDGVCEFIDIMISTSNEVY